MDLGQSIREHVLLVINGMSEWQFNQLQLREYLSYLTPEESVKAIIVVHVQETAPNQVLPLIFSLLG